MIIDPLVWNKILEPFSEDNPSGLPIRLDIQYDQLREARRMEDKSLSQGVWKRDVKVADWLLTQNLALDMLQNKSKDLQVFSWLTESLTAQYHLEGAAEGLEKLKIFMIQFWDTLHPLPNEHDDVNFQSRLNVLENLGKLLLTQFLTCSITDGSQYQEDSLPYIYLINAKQNQKLSSRMASSEKGSLKLEGPTYQDIVEKVKITPKTFYEERTSSLEDIFKQLNDIKDFLDKSTIAPAWSDLYDTLQEMKRFFEQASAWAYTKTVQVNQKISEEKNVEEGEPIFKEEKRDVPDPQTLSNSYQQRRFDLYNQLNKLVGELVKLEPFHPVPYLVNRLLQWGVKPGDQVLIEWAQSPATLDALLNIAGFKSPPTGAQTE